MAETRDKVKEGIDTAAQGAKRLTDRAADTMQSAQTAVGGKPGEGLMDTAKHGINAAADRAGEIAGQAREKVREWAGDAGESVSHAADKAQHWAEDAYQYSGEQLGEFGRECATAIRRYPIQALAVAFGVGLLLGRATRA